MGVKQDMNNIYKIFSVIRYIFGAIFVIAGLGSLVLGDIAAGIFMMLTGVALLPILYKKINFKKFKYAPIVLPIIFLVMSIVFVSLRESDAEPIETDTTTVSQEENQTEEEKKIEIESLNFNESELEIDIKEIKDIVLEVSPNNADIENLEYLTSDEKIVLLEKSDVTDDKSKITLHIKPLSEGVCEIFAKSNSVESNKVTLKVVDNERIQAEKKAQEEAEEKAKQEAEEQAQREAAEKEAAEKAKQEAQRQAQQKKQSQNSSNSNKSSSKKSNSNNSHGRVIYYAPRYGKKYHYDPDCAGKNAVQTTLDKVSYLGPCKKCVH